MRFVCLKGDLQYSVSQTVSIEASYRHGSLIIVCHSHKSKTFAFIGVKVTDDLHVGQVDQQSGSTGQIIFSTTLTLGAEIKYREEVPIIRKT